HTEVGIRLPGKHETPAGSQCIDPTCKGLGGGRVDIDDVGCRQRTVCSRRRTNIDVGIGAEVPSSSRCYLGFDLECCNRTRFADKARKNCGVETVSTANMEHALAGFWINRGKPLAMQARLTVVDALFPIYGEQQVLLQPDRIGGWRRHVPALSEGKPWTRREEVFPMNSAKGSLDVGNV